MNVCFWVVFLSSLDELINKFVVLLSTNARTFQAKIELIIQQFVILSDNQHQDRNVARNSHRFLCQVRPVMFYQDVSRHKRSSTPVWRWRLEFRQRPDRQYQGSVRASARTTSLERTDTYFFAIRHHYIIDIISLPKLRKIFIDAISIFDTRSWLAIVSILWGITAL